MVLNQAISFLYNSVRSGTNFNNEIRVDISKNINVKLK